MKKALQLSVVLFALTVVVSVAPAAPLSGHFHNAIIAAQPAGTAIAQSQPQQQQPTTTDPQTQPQDQNPPADQTNPNAQPMHRHRANRNADNGNLPRTASPLPMLGLIGLISLGGIVLLRRIARVLS